MALSDLHDTVRQIFTRLRELTDRVYDLESEHGEVSGFHFGNAFPSEPYPNQIVVKTDESPPDGGVMYRYDQAASAWKRLN